jgi:hypothetical protein
MCLVLFIIPALKYPANPPAVGDPKQYTIDRVYMLHLLPYLDSAL